MFPRFSYLSVFLFIVSFVLLFVDSAFAVIPAMAIPIVDLYTDTSIGAGRFAMHHFANYVVTRVSEGSILFGRAVCVGTSQDQIKTITTGKALAGVAAHSVSASEFSNEIYLDKDVVGVIKSGMVGVYVEEAVSRGDAVRVRIVNHASLAAKVAGNFCKTAEAGKTALVSGAEWVSDSTASGVVILYLRDSASLTAD